MDMDIEVEEFERTQTPSLIGETIRGNHHQGSELEEKGKDRTRSLSRPAVLPTHNLESAVSLTELEDEGALMNDEEGEFVDKVLDDEGHVKEDSLHISEKLKTAQIPPSKTSAIPKIVENEQDDEAVHIFGGDGDKYIAPASKPHSVSVTPTPSFKVTTPKTETFLGSGKETEEVSAEERLKLQEVIDHVNNGEIVQEEAKAESVKSTASPGDIVEEKEPEIPDSAADIDAAFTVPAGAREGLSSPLLSRATSQQRYTQGSLSPAREGTGTNKPHLARGDSYHGALSNEDYTQPLQLSERKPRHDPTASLSKTASLNYLRSISRSRSRAANDRSAIGVDRGMDSDELKQEGALMGDQFSDIPELEDAVGKALNLAATDEESIMEESEPEEETAKEPESEKPETEESKKTEESSSYVPKEDKMTFEDEPVYLYTSLAGGFQVASRTTRLANILSANKIEFSYKDLGTDEAAKKIWKTYSSGKTLPGIVRGRDDFIGNWEDIEEANEAYEVRSLVYETV